MIEVALALRMEKIGKAFPGVQALSEVDLEVGQGEVHAIVGENGAGKSTLMKILAGVYQPDAGSIHLNGVEVVLQSPLEAKRQGIRMVYQELNLVPDLSVSENIALGRIPKKRGLVDRARMDADARGVLSELQTKIVPSMIVGDLTVSQQQLVEIAKAYASEPKIIVLDEPTSSLSEHETQALFRVIRRMSSAGVSVIYISHRLREVIDIADTVTVIRDGRRIDTQSIDGVTVEKMISLMVGRQLDEVFPKKKVPIGDTILEVKNVSVPGRCEDVSFTVRAGEIVGLAGLVGAGRTEVAQAIFGLRRYSRGQVIVGGVSTHITRPRKGIKAGIAYVPEDRKTEGIIPSESIRNNISLAVLPSLQRAGFIERRKEKELAQQKAHELGVSPPLIERLANTLSGGNQQKVVLAKWLAAKPTVLILDEPTRGVDVGAKADIHTIIGELAAQGVGILMISSELPEILAVSDRIYVLHEGRVTEEIARSDASEERVMRAATGGGLS
jgi:ABC-type sugar transport system ATPase subunit